VDSAFQQLLDDAIRHHGGGDLQSADRLYRQVLSHNPKQPVALHYLGVIALQLGRFDTAVDLIGRATVESPGDADAHSNLGNALQAHGQVEAAVKSYEAALQINPEMAETRANLGNALSQLGRFSLAASEYLSALKSNPDLHETRRNLANSYLSLGRLGEALTSINQARKQNPGSLEIVVTAGNILNQLGRLNEAIDCYETVLKAQPEIPQVLSNLGNALKDQGRVDEAIVQYDRALALDSSYVEGHYNLGIAFQDKGDINAAVSSFRHALSLDENYGKAHRCLASLVKHTEVDADVEDMERAYKFEGTKTVEKMHIAFGLGKSYEDLEKYDLAFDYYEAANALNRDSFEYDLAKDARVYANLKNCFRQSVFKHFDQPPDNTTIKPIFVLGMPRSGTTLVEQILASHADVHGGGELNALPQSIARYLPMQDGLDYTAALDFKDSQVFQSIAGDYLLELDSLSPDVSRVTDKLPMNFLHIGMIKLLFPDAVVIHCQRNPLDTCLSIFKNYFPASGHQYAYELSELAGYYNLYLDLMAHWRQVLPGFIYDLDYESLVSSQEGESRKLIDACGLPWDPACLDFHKNSRQVSTISASQVRRTIYQDSVKLWQQYDHRLGVLKQTLQVGSGNDL
jgi:tetratricopeptide (TPR) repeat protein